MIPVRGLYISLQSTLSNINIQQTFASIGMRRPISKVMICLCGAFFIYESAEYTEMYKWMCLII